MKGNTCNQCLSQSTDHRTLLFARKSGAGESPHNKFSSDFLILKKVDITTSNVLHYW